MVARRAQANGGDPVTENAMTLCGWSKSSDGISVLQTLDLSIRGAEMVVHSALVSLLRPRLERSDRGPDRAGECDLGCHVECHSRGAGALRLQAAITP